MLCLAEAADLRHELANARHGRFDLGDLANDRDQRRFAVLAAQRPHVEIRIPAAQRIDDGTQERRIVCQTGRDGGGIRIRGQPRRSAAHACGALLELLQHGGGAGAIQQVIAHPQDRFRPGRNLPAGRGERLHIAARVQDGAGARLELLPVA